MECLTAKVLKGQTVIADGVDAFVAVTDAGGTQEWNGTFELPTGKEIAQGKGYRLELEDGRSGDITITNVNVSDHGPTTVGFRGTGPLT